MLFLSYKKEKMPNLSTKEKKAKRRIVVKEFNDELLNLVMIQYEMKKLDVIWQKQIIKINEMHDKIEERKELIEYLTVSPAKNNNREKTAIKMFNRLKPELECKQDLVTREEFKTSKIFDLMPDLHHDRRIARDELTFTSSKLEKLGVPKTKIDEIKESNNLGQSSWSGCS